MEALENILLQTEESALVEFVKIMYDLINADRSRKRRNETVTAVNMLSVIVIESHAEYQHIRTLDFNGSNRITK